MASVTADLAPGAGVKPCSAGELGTAFPGLPSSSEPEVTYLKLAVALKVGLPSEAVTGVRWEGRDREEIVAAPLATE